MRKLGTTTVIVLMVFVTITIPVLAGTWVNSNANTYYTTPGGNVGIGTTNPVDSLHINKTNVNYYDTNWGKMMIGDAAGSWWFGSWVDGGAASNNVASNAYLTDRWRRRKGGYEAWIMGNYITNANQGSFSIFHANAEAGDNTPITNSKQVLRIDAMGVVTVKELVVSNAGWADYVFKNDYQLRPLHEVEAFIENNGHLPNIPTSNDVKENGISVGDMQQKQMEKIEELTLYVIQLQKEINDLKTQVK